MNEEQLENLIVRRDPHIGRGFYIVDIESWDYLNDQGELCHNVCTGGKFFWKTRKEAFAFILELFDD